MGQRRLGLAPHLPWRCFNLYFTKTHSWFSFQALTHLLLTEEDASFTELLDGLEVGLGVTPAVEQCCRSGGWMRHTVVSRCLHGRDFQVTSQALAKCWRALSCLLHAKGADFKWDVEEKQHLKSNSCLNISASGCRSASTADSYGAFT